MSAYREILNACGNCNTPLYCASGNAVCRRWARGESMSSYLDSWKADAIQAVLDAAHGDLGLPPESLTRVEPDDFQEDEPEDAEPPCDHSPAAWRTCTKCSDAEGDLREHDGR